MHNKGTRTTQQLLMQIDGLSRPVLEEAIADGDMPNLSRLAADSENQLLSVFTGLPSTTPAVQGELLYGIPCIVPAFAFMHDRREARHMVDPSAAGEVERELRKQGEPLLKGGSSYCNIYTAGSRVSRFCPSELAEPAKKLARGFRYNLRLLASYAGVGFRALTMLIAEITRYAIFRRYKLRKNLRQTIQDTWDRIMLCIVLRDHSRLSAMHDIRAGLPVVHINFLGYDKQSHRYGPRSDPARRTLKGIDTAIGTLIDEIRRAAGDNATVIVYSDHGQEGVTAVQRLTGKPIEIIVRDAAETVMPDGVGPTGVDTHTESEQRDMKRTIAQEVGEQFLGIGASQQEGPGGDRIATVESGPIAHVYLDDRVEPPQRRAIARAITDAAPGVAAICRDEHDALLATVNGEEPMPLHDVCASRLVQHPFAEHIESDIRRLISHHDAGDIILFGAGFTDSPVTFPQEKGAHGGPGPEETHAFAITPGRFNLDGPSGNYKPRFADLREAVIKDREPDA